MILANQYPYSKKKGRRGGSADVFERSMSNHNYALAKARQNRLQASCRLSQNGRCHVLDQSTSLQNTLPYLPFHVLIHFLFRHVDLEAIWLTGGLLKQNAVETSAV